MRLQRLRAAAGMSQSKLAESAGVPIGTLRNWEQGRRVPLLDTAARVAAALGVSLDELAGASAEGAVPAESRPGRPRKPESAAGPTDKPAPKRKGRGKGK